LLQRAGDAAAAEAKLHEAIDIAWRQGARLFALRAATDLAQLLQEQGRASDGDAVLRPVLDAMPEGLDQPDALRAKLVLQELGSAARSSP